MFKLFGKKQSKKGHLGQESAFYYNEKLKRWVEKGKEDEAAKESELPPPPTSLPQSLSRHSLLSDQGPASQGSVTGTSLCEGSDGGPSSAPPILLHKRSLSDRYVPVGFASSNSTRPSTPISSLLPAAPAPRPKPATFFIPSPAVSSNNLVAQDEPQQPGLESEATNPTISSLQSPQALEPSEPAHSDGVVAGAKEDLNANVASGDTHAAHEFGSTAAAAGNNTMEEYATKSNEIFDQKYTSAADGSSAPEIKNSFGLAEHADTSMLPSTEMNGPSVYPESDMNAAYGAVTNAASVYSAYAPAESVYASDTNAASVYPQFDWSVWGDYASWTQEQKDYYNAYYQDWSAAQSQIVECSGHSFGDAHQTHTDVAVSKSAFAADLGNGESNHLTSTEMLDDVEILQPSYVEEPAVDAGTPVFTDIPLTTDAVNRGSAGIVGAVIDDGDVSVSSHDSSATSEQSSVAGSNGNNLFAPLNVFKRANTSEGKLAGMPWDNVAAVDYDSFWQGSADDLLEQPDVGPQYGYDQAAGFLSVEPKLLDSSGIEAPSQTGAFGLFTTPLFASSLKPRDASSTYGFPTPALGVSTVAQGLTFTAGAPKDTQAKKVETTQFAVKASAEDVWTSQCSAPAETVHAPSHALADLGLGSIEGGATADSEAERDGWTGMMLLNTEPAAQISSMDITTMPYKHTNGHAAIEEQGGQDLSRGEAAKATAVAMDLSSNAEPNAADSMSEVNSTLAVVNDNAVAMPLGIAMEEPIERPVWPGPDGWGYVEGADYSKYYYWPDFSAWGDQSTWDTEKTTIYAEWYYGCQYYNHQLAQAQTAATQHGSSAEPSSDQVAQNSEVSPDLQQGTHDNAAEIAASTEGGYEHEQEGEQLAADASVLESAAVVFADPSTSRVGPPSHSSHSGDPGRLLEPERHTYDDMHTDDMEGVYSPDDTMQANCKAHKPGYAAADWDTAATAKASHHTADWGTAAATSSWNPDVNANGWTADSATNGWHTDTATIGWNAVSLGDGWDMDMPLAHNHDTHVVSDDSEAAASVLSPLRRHVSSVPTANTPQPPHTPPRDDHTNSAAYADEDLVPPTPTHTTEDTHGTASCKPTPSTSAPTAPVPSTTMPVSTVPETVDFHPSTSAIPQPGPGTNTASASAASTSTGLAPIQPVHHDATQAATDLALPSPAHPAGILAAACQDNGEDFFAHLGDEADPLRMLSPAPDLSESAPAYSSEPVSQTHSVPASTIHNTQPDPTSFSDSLADEADARPVAPTHAAHYGTSQVSSSLTSYFAPSHTAASTTAYRQVSVSATATEEEEFFAHLGEPEEEDQFIASRQEAIPAAVQHELPSMDDQPEPSYQQVAMRPSHQLVLDERLDETFNDPNAFFHGLLGMDSERDSQGLLTPVASSTPTVQTVQIEPTVPTPKPTDTAPSMAASLTANLQEAAVVSTPDPLEAASSNTKHTPHSSHTADSTYDVHTSHTTANTHTTGTMQAALVTRITYHAETGHLQQPRALTAEHSAAPFLGESASPSSTKGPSSSSMELLPAYTPTPASQPNHLDVPAGSHHSMSTGQTTPVELASPATHASGRSSPTSCAHGSSTSPTSQVHGYTSPASQANGLTSPASYANDTTLELASPVNHVSHSAAVDDIASSSDSAPQSYLYDWSQNPRPDWSMWGPRESWTPDCLAMYDDWARWRKNQQKLRRSGARKPPSRKLQQAPSKPQFETTKNVLTSPEHSRPAAHTVSNVVSTVSQDTPGPSNSTNFASQEERPREAVPQVAEPRVDSPVPAHSDPAPSIHSGGEAQFELEQHHETQVEPEQWNAVQFEHEQCGGAQLQHEAWQKGQFESQDVSGLAWDVELDATLAGLSQEQQNAAGQPAGPAAEATPAQPEGLAAEVAADCVVANADQVLDGWGDIDLPTEDLLQEDQVVDGWGNIDPSNEALQHEIAADPAIVGLATAPLSNTLPSNDFFSQLDDTIEPATEVDVIEAVADSAKQEGALAAKGSPLSVAVPDEPAAGLTSKVLVSDIMEHPPIGVAASEMHDSAESIEARDRDAAADSLDRDGSLSELDLQVAHYNEKLARFVQEREALVDEYLDLADQGVEGIEMPDEKDNEVVQELMTSLGKVNQQVELLLQFCRSNGVDGEAYLRSSGML